MSATASRLATDQTPLFLGSALFCAAVTAYIFFDLYFSRLGNSDAAVLTALFAASTLSLHSAYTALYAAGAAARPHSDGGVNVSHADAAAAYFAVFKANFAYFSLLAFLSYVALPAFGGAGAAKVLGLPWGWWHSGLSVLPASAFVYSLRKP